MELDPVEKAEVRYRAALYILRENLTGDLNAVVSQLLQSAVAYSEALAADCATKLDQLKLEMHADVAKAVEGNPE